MRGSLIQRGKNWSAVLDLGAENGRRRQKWVSLGPITKKEAQARLAQLLTSVATGQYVSPSKQTLSSFAQDWLRDYASAMFSPRTGEGYASIINYHVVNSTIGKMPLTSIQPKHIQQFIASKLNDRSARTVNHILMCLRSVFRSAVTWGMVPRNPCDGTTTPKPTTFNPQILTEGAVAQILKHCQQLGTFGVLFNFLIFMGCRRAEALALTWADFDTVNGFVTINKGLHALKGGKIVIGNPKTVSSKRCVPMGPHILKIMVIHKETQMVEKKFLGRDLAGSDYVFCNPNGKPLLPDGVSHAWTKLVARLGLPATRLHDCRHFHASQLLRAGVPAKVVSKRLGHASISTTLNLYTHINETTEKMAALQFDASLTKELEQLC